MEHVVDALEELEKSCLGCYACKNVCLSGAISIDLNEEGFLKSSVDTELCTECGTCIDVCPIINHSTGINMSRPKSYAFMANDKVLAMSSSGGAVSILAGWTLHNGGYVCGALYDDDMNVVYKLTNDRSTIRRMYGSKYVLSEMRGVYKDVKACLSQGHIVLFVGLPCHAAALRNYIGEDDKLFTVDLICSGMPSKSIYKKYIKEEAGGKRIRNLTFRSKQVPYGTLIFDFADGTSKTNFKDPYFAGFNANLYKDDCCANCDFAAAPRHADLTIGDLWDSERLFYDFDSSKGVSAVLVNNAAGRKLMNVLIENSTFLREIPFDFVRRFNRLHPERKHHLGRKRMYYMLERGYSVRKSIKYCLEWKYDVGITGLWRVPNYGGDLTYYALFNIIKDLGLEPAMIEARSNNKFVVPGSPKRLVNAYPLYSIIPWAHDKRQQTEVNLRIYTLMVGSDQVWNPNLFEGHPETVYSYALDFSTPWRNTVAYASSFGKSTYEPETEVEKEQVKALRNIKHVSVREKSGVDICKNLGIEAKHVLDPVMLCGMQHYQALLDKATMEFPEHYGLCFIRHIGEHLEPLRLADFIGLDFVNIVGPDINLDEVRTSYPMTHAGTVENWVKSIYYADYVLTDSFHAAALCIIFGKQFTVTYGNMGEETGLDRFRSLLGMFDLECRMYQTTWDAVTSKDFGVPIDYNKVNAKLESLREESLNWLKDALEIEKEY